MAVSTPLETCLGDIAEDDLERIVGVGLAAGGVVRLPTEKLLFLLAQRIPRKVIIDQAANVCRDNKVFHV